MPEVTAELEKFSEYSSSNLIARNLDPAGLIKENAILHLRGSPTFNSVKIFLAEQGGNVRNRNGDFISNEEISKVQLSSHAMKILLSVSRCRSEFSYLLGFQ